MTSLDHHLLRHNRLNEALALSDLVDGVVAHASLAEITLDNDGGGDASHVTVLVEVGDVQLNGGVVISTHKVGSVAALARDVKLDVFALLILHVDGIKKHKKNTTKTQTNTKKDKQIKNSKKISYRKKVSRTLNKNNA